MTLPPGPNMPSVLVTWHWLRRPFELMEELRAQHGDTFTIGLSGSGIGKALPPFVVFSDPEAVKEIFTGDDGALRAGRFNQSLRPFLGDHSVLMLDGPEHLRQRRLLLPPFHGERMHAYGQAMLDAADASIDRWPHDRPFAVHPHMQAITLEVILRTVFGLVDPAELARMSHVLAELMELGTWPPLLIPWVQTDLGPYSPWGRFVRKKAAAHALLDEQIARARRAHAEGAAPRQDVLSLLVAARDENGDPLTDAELRDELITLLVAGHETTATALAWSLRWILAQPRTEGRLREELTDAQREALAAGEPALGPARIAKLELLDSVTRETLRLQPVVPIVGRILDRPTRVGGWDLPAGVGVVCSIYLAQRREQAYPDAARFDPDRFRHKKVTPYEFFPFGGGIRRCIGMAFALYEMKMVLVRILQRTDLRLADPDRVRVVRRSITLMPSRGLRVISRGRRPAPRPLGPAAGAPTAPG